MPLNPGGVETKIKLVLDKELEVFSLVLITRNVGKVSISLELVSPDGGEVIEHIEMYSTQGKPISQATDFVKHTVKNEISPCSIFNRAEVTLATSDPKT